MDQPSSPAIKAMSARELMTKLNANNTQKAGATSASATNPSYDASKPKQPAPASGPLRRFSISSGIGFNEFTSGIRAGWQNELFSRKFRAAVLAEFIGMTLFVAFSTAIVTFNLFGAPTGTTDGFAVALISRLIIAFGFGLMITVLVFAIGDVSGANLNPAVTLALTISRKMSLLRCACYMSAQVLGAIVGSAYIRGLLPSAFKQFPAVNSVSAAITSASDYSLWTPIGAELLGTYLLVFTVCCAADVGRDSHTKYVGALTPLAIGFVVFLAHLWLVPIDGCSINPARSFGSAVVMNKWEDHWVFWVGPFSGSILACLSYEYIFKAPPVSSSSSSSSSGSSGSESGGRPGGYTGVGPEASTVFGRDVLEGIERTISSGSTAGRDNMSLGEPAAVSTTTMTGSRALRVAELARNSAAPGNTLLSSSGPAVGATSVEMSPILSASSAR